MQQMKTIIIGVLLLCAVVVGSAYADSGIRNSFNTRYGTSGTVLSSCDTCHTSAPDFNPYGQDLFDSGTNFAAIESLDSDGDGYSNLTEITARTFPGDALSVPASGDTTLPTVNTFTIPATSSSLTVAISALTATDNVGVTGYLVNESSIKPSATAAGWSASVPGSYTFATQGAKTLYAWAKDAAGNVANSRSAFVTVTISTPPPTPGGGGMISPATSSLYWDDSSKKLGVGTSNPMSSLHVMDENANFNRGLTIAEHYSGVAAALINIKRSRGTESAPEAVVNGDNAAAFHVQTYDGTSYIVPSSIMFTIDGAVSTNNVPTAISFVTGTSTSNRLERARITADGFVGIGTSTPNEALEVNGGLALYTTQIRPVCNADSRGTFWFTQDDLNGDSADVCARVGGVYSWRKLF